jgi:hypothetical protein
MTRRMPGDRGDVVALGEQPAEFQNFLMSVLMACTASKLSLQI